MESLRFARGSDRVCYIARAANITLTRGNILRDIIHVLLHRGQRSFTEKKPICSINFYTQARARATYGNETITILYRVVYEIENKKTRHKKRYRLYRRPFAFTTNGDNFDEYVLPRRVNVVCPKSSNQSRLSY